MKKRLSIITALFIAVSTLSGCAMTGSPSPEATEEESNDPESAQSNDAASEASSTELIILRDLFEPLFEEASASASSSTIEKAETEEEKEDAKEEIQKLTFVFFGDSQIANGRADGTDIATLITRRVPNSESINLGIGGTTAALEQSTSDYLDYENWNSTCFLGMVYALEGKVDREKLLSSQPTVLENMNKVDPEEVDYYVIEYGANDFFNKTPLDHTQTELNQVYHFYGAMCLGIDELKKISPNAKFIVMTPFYSVYKDADGNIIGDSYIVSNGIGTLAEYAKKAVNVAEDEGAIDFDGMFMAHSDLYLDTIEKYTIDGIHLSLTGRQIFARLLAHLPNWAEGYEPYAYLETDNIKIDEFDPEQVYRYRDDMLQYYYPEYYEKMMNGEYLLAPPPQDTDSENESDNDSNNEASSEAASES